MMPTAQIKNASTLGQAARNARKSQGLTLKELSERAGLGIRFLSEFERGKETTELGKALIALHVLGVSLTLAPGKVPADDPLVGGDSLSAPEPAPGVENIDTGASQYTAAIHLRGSRPAPGGDAGRLWDMLVAVDNAREISRTCAGAPALQQTTVMKRALERCFDVLGEAARRVTPQTQARFQRIPWREIITRRNGLVLNYEHVDHGALFGSAVDGLPHLEAGLEAALAALGSPTAGQIQTT